MATDPDTRARGEVETARAQQSGLIVAAGAVAVAAGTAWTCLVLGASFLFGGFVGLPLWEWAALGAMALAVVGGLGLLYTRGWAVPVTSLAAVVIVAAQIMDGTHFLGPTGIVSQLLYYAMPVIVVFALARDGRRVRGTGVSGRSPSSGSDPPSG